MKKLNLPAALAANLANRTTSVAMLIATFCLLFITGNAQLISWNTSAIGSNYGSTPFAPATTNANITVAAGGLIRGSGISASGTGAGASWGGSGGWTTNTDAGCVYFSFTANAGYNVSLSSITGYLRRSTSGPGSGTIEYSLNGGAYIAAGTWATGSTSTGGASWTQALSGVAALQNVAAGTVIKIRFTFVSGSGNWYITNGASALILNGTTVASAPVYSASIVRTGTILCNGDANGALTANVTNGTAPYTYSWVPSGGTGSVATGLAAGNYTCLVTDATAATTSASFVLVQPAVLAATTSSVKNVGCLNGTNGSATITASGGTSPFTYSWSPSGGTNAIATNLAAGDYTVSVTDSKLCATTKTLTITQPTAALTITANVTNSVICGGSTITLTGSGATTYTWTGGAVNNSAFSPTATTDYTVNGTNAAGCTASAAISVTVNPTPTITVNSGTICPGGSFVLTPTGAGSYTFSSGTDTVTPSGTDTYTVYGTSAEGCAASATATVNVSGSLIVSISGPTVICFGETATFTANGASTYEWSTGDITSSIAPSPTTTTSYTVTGSSGSCSNTAVTTVSVNALPVVSISGTSVICNGETVNLTVSGASTYTWDSGVNTTTIATTPTTNTTYTVTGTDTNGCLNSAINTVTVNALPVITINSGAVCPGATFILTPGGAATYTFSSGSATLNPVSSDTYSVYGTSAEGCLALAPAISTVNVTGSLNVTISGPTVICSGDAANLTANGAGSYTWSTGETTYTIAPTPGVNTTYTVIGSSGSCSNSAVASISVNASPTVSIAGSSVICAGVNTTLTASGAVSYSWNTGATTASIATSPSTTTAYTATGTGANGCPASVVKTITVNPTPTISVPNGTICSGTSFTLNPTGANTYTYSGGNVVSPTITTTYSVTGTSLPGCLSAASATVTITVNALPVVTVNSGSVCAGKVFTMTASGAASYTFSNGSNTVIPTGNTSYSVTGMSAQGCISATPAISNVTLNALPVISVNSGSVCSGKTFTIVPSGASTYTYSNGAATATPTGNASYTVTGTSSVGCVSATFAVADVTVYTTPTITVAGGTICAGASFTLSPSGAATYSYSGGNIVSPATTTSYSVTGTSTSGCVSSSVVATITVSALPAITVNSGSVCAGKTFTMVPTGAVTYTFSNNSNTVTPIANTSYSVTGTSSAGCISSTPAISSVTVNALPVITVNSGTVCAGRTYTMVPTGASTYTYSNGSNIVIPTGNASYTVTGTSSVGCVSATFAVADVTVNAVPVLTVNSGTTCAGTPFVLVPSGALTYTYSGGSATVSPTSNTSYSVSGTNSLGCVSTSSAIATITAIALPVITVNSGSICAGGSFTVNPAGAATYTFINGATVVNPSSTTSYSVSGTNTAGCVSQTAAVATVTVNALPTISITASPTVCNGSSLSIVASGADSYTWSTSSNSATITVSPSASTDYTVNGRSTAGCPNSAVHSLTVHPTPTINVPGGSICPGGSFTLTPTGAATYTFSSGPIVSPSSSTSFSVTGTSSLGCVSQTPAIAAVTVTNSIIVSAAGTTVICDGQAAALTASGANTYTWNTGDVNSTISPAPSANTTYTVTGSSGTCSNTAVISVNVLSTPTITITSAAAVICEGQTAMFTTSGAASYTWSNGIPNNASNSVVFTPSASAGYSVSGTGANGCVSIASSSVTVNGNPTLTASSSQPTLCTGEAVSITVSGALTYSWNTNATTAVITVTPAQTTTYSVKGIDANGCITTTVVSQEVAACTGIDAISGTKAQSLIIFPNPNNGDFTIKGNLDTRLTLVNELGQVILVTDKNDTINNEIRVKGLNPGIYFLSGSHNNTPVKQKIIVTR